LSFQESLYGKRVTCPKCGTKFEALTEEDRRSKEEKEKILREEKEAKREAKRQEQDQRNANRIVLQEEPVRTKGQIWHAQKDKHYGNKKEKPSWTPFRIWFSIIIVSLLVVVIIGITISAKSRQAEKWKAVERGEFINTFVTIDGKDIETDTIIRMVNLWDNYETRSRVVSTAEHGEKVQLIRRKGKGVLIEKSDGTRGWVTYWFIRELK
jgi:hypothetical protein